jgi:Uri superfamily endonuclease
MSYLIRFEDKSVLHKKFKAYEEAANWAVDYVNKYPRLTKVKILKEVAEISTSLTVAEMFLNEENQND